MRILVVAGLLATSSYGGLPEIEDMADDEQVTVKLLYSEPGITEYQFLFRGGEVSIRENGKLLGTLKITEAEAARIDLFLDTVRRAKRASRHVLGAPVYRITHEESGRKSGEWTYRVGSLRETTKPTLSMRQLLERVGQK